ncbi:MAG TPA: MarR family winged helix-turn-helix transcriptional regulator [Polyangia bacterium]|jgi:DNA-binding MarR family transcriptional regulator
MGDHTNATPPPPDAAAREVLDGVRRIVRVLRESSRASERHVGLSAAQLFVLQRLAQTSALSMNELAAQTLTHQSSVSVVVSKLVARHLVARAASSADGRRVEVTLTKAGRAVVARTSLVPAQDRLIAGVLRLPPKDRAALADGLRRLVAAMSLPTEAPGMFFEDAPPAKRRRASPVTRAPARKKA